jgi:hypothetical protein
MRVHLRVPNANMKVRRNMGRLARKLPVLGYFLRVADSLSAIQERVQAIDRQIAFSHSMSVVRLLDFELPNHPRYSDPKRLLCWAFQACSQNGEDGMLREIFRRIGASKRVFCEIGVGDGNENNTAFLISQGWTGFWVDGNPKIVQTVKARGWDSAGLVRARQAFVTRENARDVLQDLKVPDDCDLLSIDVDQNTYYIWEALENVTPRVVVVEYNAAVPPDIEWAVEYRPDKAWDGTQNFGASLKAFERLGASRGYCLVGCDFTGVNAFFVREDLCKDRFAEPYTAENHFEPARYGAFARRGHPPSALDAHRGGRSN